MESSRLDRHHLLEIEEVKLCAEVQKRHEDIRSPQTLIYIVYCAIGLILNGIISYFLGDLPKGTELVALVFFLILWSLFCRGLPIAMQPRKTAYTRKAYHIIVFITSAILHSRYGLGAVCVFGIIISLHVFYSLLYKGALYRALARENDHPYESRYIILPYLATLIGGLTINLIIPEYAVFGYVICGLADASGEVVGAWVGRNEYKPNLFIYVTGTKSVQGSLAIFILSSLLFVLLAGPMIDSNRILLYSILFGSIITTIENFSPKGMDNFTIQVSSALLAIGFIQLG